MDLCTDILATFLCKREMHVVFPGLDLSAEQIVEGTCYKALQEIKAILENDDLEDEGCFMKIEEIIRVFEKMDNGCGTRHDFG